MSFPVLREKTYFLCLLIKFLRISGDNMLRAFVKKMSGVKGHLTGSVRKVCDS